jgi:hypothetical protein
MEWGCGLDPSDSRYVPVEHSSEQVYVIFFLIPWKVEIFLTGWLINISRGLWKENGALCEIWCSQGAGVKFAFICVVTSLDMKASVRCASVFLNVEKWLEGGTSIDIWTKPKRDPGPNSSLLLTLFLCREDKRSWFLRDVPSCTTSDPIIKYFPSIPLWYWYKGLRNAIF